MRFDRQAVARELRSWAIPAIVAIPLGLLFSIGLSKALPEVWVRVILFALALLPPVAIQLVDRWALFAIFVWLVPATATALVAFTVGASVGWVALLAAGLTGWLLCMYQWAINGYGRLVRWFADQLVLLTMPSRERTAYRGFLSAHSATRHVRRAVNQHDNPAAVRALRGMASEFLRLDAPDARWAEVFRACASVYAQDAEMLEGTRPLDSAAIKALAKGRDELVIALLRERSGTYRIVNYSPMRRRRRRRDDDATADGTQ